MKNKLLGIILAITLINPASAVVAFGSPDCGKWLKGSTAQKELSKAWLLGFMSGLNLDGRNKNYDALQKINSAEQIFAWMDNFCIKNPLKDVHAGGQDLMIELDKK